MNYIPEVLTNQPFSQLICVCLAVLGLDQSHAFQISWYHMVPITTPQDCTNSGIDVLLAWPRVAAVAPNISQDSHTIFHDLS